MKVNAGRNGLYSTWIRALRRGAEETLEGEELEVGGIRSRRRYLEEGKNKRESKVKIYAGFYFRFITFIVVSF